MTRGRLLRYAAYQLADYAVERGALSLLVVALTLGPTLYIEHDRFGRGWGVGPEGLERVRALLRDFAIPLAISTTLFAINAINSMDRQRGYVRFLFAKPVSVPAFYAQDFLVRFVGIALVCVVVLLSITLASGAPFQTGFLAYVALAYVLVGGMGFLLSALVNFDGLALVLVLLVSAVATGFHQTYPERRALAVLARVLPPVDALDGARDAFILGGAPMPASQLAGTIGYGVACFALGCVVLARRELAR